MFNPNSGSKSTHKKLPKAVLMMVEKGNLVMAIKTLAADENISMEAAKARIDAYEAELKYKQHQNLTTIASKQGIPNEAISFDREPEIEVEELPDELIKQRVKTTQPERSFKSLQDGVDSKLGDLGYKEPILSRRLKRLLVIAIIMIGLFWILWRVFG